MPTYIWSARDRYGNPIVVRLAAGSAEQARSELLSRGYTDLRLETDEVFARLSSASIAELPPEKVLKLRAAGRIQWQEVLQRNFQRMPWFYVLLAALFGVDFYLGRMGWAAVCLVAMLVFYGWGLLFYLPGVVFGNMLAAAEWHNWEEVLKDINRIRRLRSWSSAAPPERALLPYEGKALAGLGKLEEAIKKFQVLEGDSQVPRWLFRSQLATIYEIAGRFDEAIELLRSAAQEDSCGGVVDLDLALRLIRRKKDIEGARRALEQAERHELNPLSKPFVTVCRGLIRLETGSYAEARADLEMALREFEAFANQSLIPGLMLLTKGYLAVACHGAGDTRQGRQYLEEAELYLQATGESELLERCRKMEGSSPGKC